jgi:single-strand DNA-binding protein
MNKIYLIGNMSKDIQITELQSGKKVGKFGLAVKRKYGEDMVDFINIVIWDKLAENVEKYCSKGSKIAIVGELQTRMYEVNGDKRYTYEVHANEIEFLSIKKEEEKAELKPITDEECPF